MKIFRRNKPIPHDWVVISTTQVLERVKTVSYYLPKTPIPGYTKVQCKKCGTIVEGRTEYYYINGGSKFLSDDAKYKIRCDLLAITNIIEE
jgi:hypothetical protein